MTKLFSLSAFAHSWHSTCKVSIPSEQMTLETCFTVYSLDLDSSIGQSFVRAFVEPFPNRDRHMHCNRKVYM